MKIEIDRKILYEVFGYGVDYGQLLMEEEKEKEELFDAFLGMHFSEKYSMPMTPTQTRRVHSRKWFKAKKKSLIKFQILLSEVNL